MTPSSPRISGLARLWPAALLLVLAAVFLEPMWGRGRVPIMRDMLFDALPQFTYAGDAIRAGHFPLWNTLSGWGKPLLADPQEGLFYPVKAFFYFLPAAWAIRLYCLAQLWIMGLAMFALARHWRLSVVPSLLAALACMFGTLTIAHLEFANSQCVLVWAPLVMMMTSKIFEALGQNQPLFSRPVVRLMTGLGVVFTLQLLGGYPEFVVGTGVFAAAYLVAHGVFLRRWRVLVKSFVAFGLGGFFALLLAAPQLLPTWEFLQYFERAEQIDAQMSLASVLPHNLLGLILPWINGSPGYSGQFWAGTILEFWMSTCYIGMLPLLLAPFSLLWLARRNRDPATPGRRFLGVYCIGAIIFGLVMALGQYTPVYAFLHQLPVFDRFRFPAKFLTLLPFALSILAGLGAQALVELRDCPNNAPLLHRVFVVISIPCGLLLAGFLVSFFDRTFFQTLTFGRFPANPVRIAVERFDVLLCLAFALAGLGVIQWLMRKPGPGSGCAALALAFINLFAVSRSIQPMLDESILDAGSGPLAAKIPHSDWFYVHSTYSANQQFLYGSRDAELLRWAAQAGVGDSWLSAGLHQTWQGGQKLLRFKTLYGLLVSLPPAQARQLAARLSVRYIVTGEKFDSIAWGGLPLVFTVTEVDQPAPRAFLAPAWQEVPDNAAALHRLLASDFDPRRQSVVEWEFTGSPTAADIRPSHAPPDPLASPGKVLTLRDSPNRTDLQVMADTPALLVLNDAWYPGWTALVDGQPQPIFRANFAFRGIFLTPGRHTVEFMFDPPVFQLGLILSLAAALLAAWLCLRPASPQLPPSFPG